MKNPLISVCIPTRNRGYSIPYVIQSICNQIENDCLNVNIFVSDNCSIDNTEKDIKLLSEKYGYVNYVGNDFNIGPMKNITKSMSLGDGEYLWGLGSDDLVIDGGLKKTVDIINKYNPDIIIHTYPHKNVKLLKNKYYNKDENIFIFNSQKEYLEFLGNQYNYDRGSYDGFLEYLLSVFSIGVVKRDFYYKMKNKIILDKGKDFFDTFNFIHVLCNHYEETQNPIVLVCDNYLDGDSLKINYMELNKKVTWTPSFSISKDSCFVYNYLLKKYNLGKNFKKLRNKNNFYWTMSGLTSLPIIKQVKVLIGKLGLLDALSRFLRKI